MRTGRSFNRDKKRGNIEFQEGKFVLYNRYDIKTVDELRRRNVELPIRFVVKRSLGYKPLILDFMSKHKTTNLFDMDRSRTTSTLNHSGLFISPYQIIRPKKTKHGKQTYTTIADIMFNLFGLRNKGRYESSFNYKKSDVLTLVNDIDIFALSLIKTPANGGKGVIMESNVQENVSRYHHYVKYIIDPEDIKILVSNEKIRKTKFMKEYYSPRFRTFINDQINGLDSFAVNNGVDLHIEYVDDDEIYQYIQSTRQPDSINSLTEMMSIDREVKSKISFNEIFVT